VLQTFREFLVFVPEPALTAYRRDNERLPHASHLEGLLVGVLVFARVLESTLAEVSHSQAARRDELTHERGIPLDAEQEQRVVALVREHGILGDPAGTTQALPDRVQSLEALSELARRVADRAEQAGVLHLANSVLWELERASEMLPSVEHGRVLAQRARVARKANAHDVAFLLYKRVAALGRSTSSPELRARAEAGLAVLAQFRGNLPLAARHFRTAAREAKRAGATDLLRVVRHGQLTIAAKRGDFSTALVYGWHAYQDAWGNSEAEAEMLLNLAQLAFDVGRTDAALAGFTAALARKPGPRLALPALGGAARAAAAVGRVDMLRQYARAVDDYRDDESFAYPIASALLDLALGFASHDRAAARVRVTAGLRLTEKYGFHELDFQLRELAEKLADWRRDSGRADQIHVAPRGETVLRDLLHEAGAHDFDAGVSGRRAVTTVG
jgi:tetratricopeptide (TPR) repeat protein